MYLSDRQRKAAVYCGKLLIQSARSRRMQFYDLETEGKTEFTESRKLANRFREQSLK